MNNRRKQRMSNKRHEHEQKQQKNKRPHNDKEKNNTNTHLDITRCVLAFRVLRVAEVHGARVHSFDGTYVRGRSSQTVSYGFACEMY